MTVGELRELIDRVIQQYVDEGGDAGAPDDSSPALQAGTVLAVALCEMAPTIDSAVIAVSAVSRGAAVFMTSAPGERSVVIVRRPVGMDRSAQRMPSRLGSIVKSGMWALSPNAPGRPPYVLPSLW